MLSEQGIVSLFLFAALLYAAARRCSHHRGRLLLLIAAGYTPYLFINGLNTVQFWYPMLILHFTVVEMNGADVRPRRTPCPRTRRAADRRTSHEGRDDHRTGRVQLRRGPAGIRAGRCAARLGADAEMINYRNPGIDRQQDRTPAPRAADEPARPESRHRAAFADAQRLPRLFSPPQKTV
jgi:hypothetical protein